METITAIVVGVLVYLVAKWLLLKSKTFAPDAEFLGAILGVVATLWQLGVVR